MVQIQKAGTPAKKIKVKTSLDKNITTAQLMAMDYRYDYSLAELDEDWRKLCRTSKYKTGAQFKPGMKLCQHFCDNFWHIENAAGQSFAQAWQDPVIMEQVRQWGLQGMSQLWLSWIRRAVFMAAGLPNSSFYRPHFAKQIIGETGLAAGTLFDPCAGWGGRMLGTVAAGWRYRACEPNPDTHANLERMMDFLRNIAGVKIDAEIHCQPVETFDLQTLGPVDIVLTSPPYFNLEVYTHDPEQSYNQFDTYDTWRDQWFRPLIKNCLDVLKPEGVSAWNVMKFKNHDLVQDLIDTHREHGWELTKTVGFESPLNNIRRLKNKDVTYIFKKPKVDQ
jgi:hypothetical protein